MSLSFFSMKASFKLNRNVLSQTTSWNQNLNDRNEKLFIFIKISPPSRNESVNSAFLATTRKRHGWHSWIIVCFSNFAVKRAKLHFSFVLRLRVCIQMHIVLWFGNLAINLCPKKKDERESQNITRDKCEHRYILITHGYRISFSKVMRKRLENTMFTRQIWQ